MREYFGDSVKYVEQKEPLGTANAIKQVKGLVSGSFLVTMGDSLIESEEFKGLSKLRNAIATFKVRNSSQYGVAESKDGFIVGLEEKPAVPKSDMINAGAYVFDGEIFDAIDKSGKSVRGEYEITDSIKILLHEGKKFSVYVLKRWEDLGKPADIQKLEGLL